MEPPKVTETPGDFSAGDASVAACRREAADGPTLSHATLTEQLHRAQRTLMGVQKVQEQLAQLKICAISTESEKCGKPAALDQ
jgi:hypothetical protein